jgi:hypothetical protein
MTIYYNLNFVSIISLRIFQYVIHTLYDHAYFHYIIFFCFYYNEFIYTIEEFEDGPEYGANSPSFCKQCQQRKKNGDCNFGMCLRCCSTNVNKYCRVKDHNLLKQKHQHEHQQQQHHPRLALPAHPVQRPALHICETPTLPSPQHDVRELHAFLTTLHLRQYFAILLENGFNTLHSLKNLSEPLLDTLGITRLDHRSTLLAEIRKINV